MAGILPSRDGRRQRVIHQANTVDAEDAVAAEPRNMPNIGAGEAPVAAVGQMRVINQFKPVGAVPLLHRLDADRVHAGQGLRAKNARALAIGQIGSTSWREKVWTSV